MTVVRKDRTSALRKINAGFLRSTFLQRAAKFAAPIWLCHSKHYFRDNRYRDTRETIKSS